MIVGLLRAIVAILPLLASGAFAQAPQPAPPAGPPQGASTEDLQSLLDVLEDEKARTELAARLRALIAAQKQAQPKDQPSFGARLIATLSQRIEDASAEAMEAATVTLDFDALGAWAERQVTDPVVRARWIDFFWKTAAVLLAGWLAWWATRRALRPSMRSIAERAPEPMLARFGFLVAHTVLDILPVAAFAAVAYGVLMAIEPRYETRVIGLMLVGATAALGAVMAIGRALLCPHAPRLRLWRLRDETASYGYIWLTRVTVVAVYGHMGADAARVLGLEPAGYGLLLKLVGLAVVAMLVILILQNRAAVTSAIRGREPAAGGFAMLRNRLADVWHVLAIVYVLASYVVWALQIDGGFLFLARASILTVLIIAVARVVDEGLSRLISRGFAIGDDLKQRFPDLESRANRYLMVLRRSLQVFVYAVMVLALLQVWGLHSFAWAESETGRRIIAAIVTVIVVVVLSVIVLELISALIERSLAAGRVSATAGVRARTLLPILRTTVKIAVVVISSLIVLSTIGIDITPLLAGAGVVGLAIGFGAQTLVKDVITGWFILMEDQVRVGDVARVGGLGGFVEAITIRTIRLRDFDGTVYTVPFSEAKIVENLTKDFSYYVFDVGMTYEEEVGRVVGALKELGAEMQADPNFKNLIIAPLEIFGVDKFDASQIVVKARIKTLPIRQWDVGREFNTRLKRKFDELGIDFPYPTRRTIQVPASELKARRREDDDVPPAIAAPTQPARDGTPPSSDVAASQGGREGSGNR